MPLPTPDFRTEFVQFALEKGVLLFGEFTTKAGRKSPYFFNSGLFDDGASLGRLGHYYAEAILASGLSFDLIFGPAYKGIPLAATVAIALAQKGHNVPFCFDRKEIKDHGEGGKLVGAKMRGRVLIIDDVITAGTAKAEAIQLIRSQGAAPAGVVIAFDRQEKGGDAENLTAISAAEAVSREHGVPVISIAGAEHVGEYLAQRVLNLEKLGGVGDHFEVQQHLKQFLAYRTRYGVS